MAPIRGSITERSHSLLVDLQPLPLDSPPRVGIFIQYLFDYPVNKTGTALGCEHRHREQLVYLSLFRLLARSKPTPAPINCARINAGTELSSIPAKVSEKARAKVTAGLAKEVEEVKK